MTPTRVAVALAAVVASELVAMAILEAVPHWSPPVRAVLDAAVLLILALPIILAMLVAPLVREVRQRRDAEERLHAAQTALRASEELHRVTLSSINEAVFLLDEHGRFVFVCPNVRLVFQLDPEDVRRLGTIDELLGAGLYDPGLIATVGEVNDVEREFQRADGERRVGLVNLRRVEIGGAFALCTCRDVTDRVRARRAEQAAHRRLQALARRFIGVQESERERVARELHDEAGQSLTGLKLGLKVVETRTADDPELQMLCSELRQAADDVHEGLHRLAVSLRPAALSQLGLERAVAEHLAAVGGRSGLAVRFTTEGAVEEGAGYAVGTAVYRFVQEALTNVIRHARATTVNVILERRNGTLLAVVEDDGCGFPPDRGNGSEGLGITGMRERAEVLGGLIRIVSSPGAGSTVAMEIPVS